MRRGELRGISWADVDLDNQRITVRWQITEQSYRRAIAEEKQGKPARYRTKPKTRSGEDRIVDLDTVSTEVPAMAGSAAARASRMGLQEQDRKLRLHLRERRALRPGRTYFELVRLVQEAGLSHLKLHGLRQLNILLQLEAGVSETIIAMRIGHTSPALIQSTYGHLIGTVGRRAAEATAALVPRQLKQAS
jgi:integrase